VSFGLGRLGFGRSLWTGGVREEPLDRRGSGGASGQAGFGRSLWSCGEVRETINLIKYKKLRSTGTEPQRLDWCSAFWGAVQHGRISTSPGWKRSCPWHCDLVTSS